VDCSSLLLFYIIELLVSFYAYAALCLESFLLGYLGFLFFLMGQILSYGFGYRSLSFGQWHTGFYIRNEHKLKRVEEDLEVKEAVNFANQSLY
jgi:hypothetical protein